MAKNEKAGGEKQTPRPREEQERQDEFFGRDFEASQIPVTAPHGQSFLDAASSGFEMGWRDTKHRWESVLDEDEVVSPEEFEKEVEDRNISYDPGMTKDQLQFKIEEYDQQQYDSQYKDRPIAKFVGALPASIPEPVNLATMPLGGAAIGRAMGSSSIKAFVGNMAKGGAQISAGTVPAEAAMQSEAYTETRPGMLGMAATVPFVAPPALGVTGKAIKGLVNAKTARTVADSPTVRAEDDIESTANAIETEGATTPPPPPKRALPESDTPQARMRDLFQDFEGGEAGWVRSFSEGSKIARDFIQGKGFDPDSPALGAFLRAEGVKQGLSSPARPGDVAFDMQQVAAGQGDAAAVKRLQDARILRQTDDGSVEPRAPFEAVMDAMADESLDQTPVRNFMNQGPDQFAARFADMSRKRGKRALESEDMDPETRIAELKEAERGMREGGTTSRVRSNYNREDLLSALDHARLEGPGTKAEPRQSTLNPSDVAPRAGPEETAEGAEGAAPQQTDGADVAPARRAAGDSEEQSAREYAESKGIDTDSTDRIMDTMIERMAECSQ